MRLLWDDPALTSRSAGEELAHAVAGSPKSDVTVRLRVSLPSTFPLAKTRPRYTVRHLLKTAVVTGEPVRYVRETPAAADAVSGAAYRDTPEAGFTPRLCSATLTELTARMPLPDGVGDDPALLAMFTDHRVVVRLCTVENEALLAGAADGVLPGLLRHPGVRRAHASGSLADDVARAASDVEEMGGSCDGIVAHPSVYWRLVTSGLLARLAEAGVRVSRTRMIAREELLLGDFRAAATLLDPAESALRLLRAAGDAPDMIEASVRIGLALHLPQHLLLMRL